MGEGRRPKRAIMPLVIIDRCMVFILSGITPFLSHLMRLTLKALHRAVFKICPTKVTEEVLGACRRCLPCPSPTPGEHQREHYCRPDHRSDNTKRKTDGKLATIPIVQPYHL